MFNNRPLNLIREQSVYVCADPTFTSDVQSVSTASARDLFTHQTGQALITLGKVFTSVPPFNDHIDRNTGELLISLGNKLKARKKARILPEEK